MKLKHSKRKNPSLLFIYLHLWASFLCIAYFWYQTHWHFLNEQENLSLMWGWCLEIHRLIEERGLQSYCINFWSIFWCRWIKCNTENRSWMMLMTLDLIQIFKTVQRSRKQSLYTGFISYSITISFLVLVWQRVCCVNRTWRNSKKILT